MFIKRMAKHYLDTYSINGPSIFHIVSGECSDMYIAAFFGDNIICVSPHFVDCIVHISSPI